MSGLYELHLHTYGCLTPDDVWELGKDRYVQYADRLAWFADEFAKVYGRRPDPVAYWEQEGGRDALRRDFLFTDPAPFACFQARFNLLIALFRIVPEEQFVLARVLRHHRDLGHRYAEYRATIPEAFTPAEMSRLFEAAAKTALLVEAESGGTFTPRLLISLARKNDTFLKQYKVLREFLAARPELAPAIVGVDLCHVEEGHPPKAKRVIFEHLLRDNAEHPERALAIVYHVGESFTDKTLASAARWVFEAHRTGVHRLGHAVSLGVDPAQYLAPAGVRTKEVPETTGERRDHLNFLIEHQDQLQQFGYQVDVSAAKEELGRIAGANPPAALWFKFDLEAAEATRAFQDALLRWLAAEGAAVESCPTSNRLIGEIQDLAHHPLPRFLRHGIAATLSTDDPGIFGCTLASERQLCLTELGLTPVDLDRLQANAERQTAGLLAGRPRP